jgi:hypothetical protein
MVYKNSIKLLVIKIKHNYQITCPIFFNLNKKIHSGLTLVELELDHSLHGNGLKKIL